MKRMKKVLAMLLAFAMVMGMSLTTFAAETATITVDNIVTDAENEDDNTVLSIVQVIAPDQTTETGWKFVNGAGTAFVSALEATSEQAAIWKLILAENGSAVVPSGTVAATSTQINNALTAVSGHKSTGFVDADNVTSIGYSSNQGIITVTSAGVYAIKGSETGYVYNNMAAYIAFGTYNTDSGIPNTLENASLNAKKIDTTIEKTNNEEDGVVEIGKKVEYTVSTTVPYIADSVSKVTYTITDTIEGATYVVDNENKVTVTVIHGGVETTEKVLVTEVNGKQTFTIDLSNIASDRLNANNSLVLKYSAIVTAQVVNNSVVPNDGVTNFTPATNVLYTGSLTMTKTGEENKVLAGATFIVYKDVVTEEDEQDVTTRYYALFDESLVLKGYTTDRQAAIDSTNKVTTGNDGKVTVYGLDDSVTYSFEEVEAPKGYSINETDSVAVWNTQTAASAKTGSASMVDTKLSALPATGGIGTAVFTIGGCVIMIAAAYFFFVSRKKES